MDALERQKGFETLVTPLLSVSRVKLHSFRGAEQLLYFFLLNKKITIVNNLFLFAADSVEFLLLNGHFYQPTLKDLICNIRPTHLLIQKSEKKSL